MKIQIYSDKEINKHWEFNKKQNEVGSPLKTYKGSRIARSSKYGVGKEIGGEIYVHKNYAEEVIPHLIWEGSRDALEKKYPDFEYNCVRYNPSTGAVSFQEVPDFDTAREPMVGEYVTVIYDPETATAEWKRPGYSKYILHHKWCWTRNDYPGTSDSWNWSKQWLSTLRETSDGNGINRWNAQLDRYGLPHDK